MADAIEIGKSRSHYLLAESIYPANKLDEPTGNLDGVANLRSVRDSHPCTPGWLNRASKKIVKNTTLCHRRGATQQTPSLREVSKGVAPVSWPDRR